MQDGVRLTGIPAWPESDRAQNGDTWRLVLFIRSLGPLTAAERQVQLRTTTSARYVGSAACRECHQDIYTRWQRTPMANVVRDPREHPDAIIPDLSTNNVAKFSKEQVALVYGSLWKQRYFTKIGDDYFPEP